MREITVIDNPPVDGGQVSFRVAFWFAVPLARRIPLTGTVTSVVPDATAAEISALADGSVKEEMYIFLFPVSWTGKLPNIKAALQDFYTDRAAYLNAQVNKLQFAKSTWDGTTWT